MSVSKTTIAERLSIRYSIVPAGAIIALALTSPVLSQTNRSRDYYCVFRDYKNHARIYSEVFSLKENEVSWSEITAAGKQYAKENGWAESICMSSLTKGQPGMPNSIRIQREESAASQDSFTLKPGLAQEILAIQKRLKSKPALPPSQKATLEPRLPVAIKLPDADAAAQAERLRAEQARLRAEQERRLVVERNAAAAKALQAKMAAKKAERDRIKVEYNAKVAAADAAKRKYDAEMKRNAEQKAAYDAAMAQYNADMAKLKITNPAAKKCDYPAYTRDDEWTGITTAEAKTRLLSAQNKVCTSNGNQSNMPGTMIGEIRCSQPQSMTLQKGAITPLAFCRVTYQCPAYRSLCKGTGGKSSKAKSE